MKQFTLLVGLNDKDTKTRIVNKNKAREVIMNIVGDCTVSDALGQYTHDNGEVVQEKSLRVDILFKELQEVMEYAKEIKKALNQESIALSYTEINSMLV